MSEIAKTYQSLLEQSIFDVALQHYGSVEGIGWLLEDNPQLVQSGGVVGMFGAAYKIRSNIYKKKTIVEQIKKVPVTEGGEDMAYWVSEDYLPWVTAVPGAGGGGSSTGARPDLFVEEATPSDANFEVYSQFGGVNKKAKLSAIGPNLANITYVPTATGNVDRNKVVTDPNGNVWFIAGNGDAVQLNSNTGGGGAWLTEEQWVTGTTITATIALPSVVTRANLRIYRSGAKMRLGSDYTVSGATITLIVAADNEVFEIFSQP